MHNVAGHVRSPEAVLEVGLRVPFGWAAKPVVPGEGNVTELHWERQDALLSDHARLRITVAVDVRDNKRIEVFALGTGSVLGTLDIRFAHVFQLYELPLPLSAALAAVKKGIGLRMTEGDSPLWFFVQDEAAGLREPVLMPHLMIGSSGEAAAAFNQRLDSLASIQQFGWMEGCVLDGLMDSGFTATARKHLDLYVKENELIYEDPRSRPCDGSFYGIESTLPIAMLTKLEPTHPLVEKAVAYMASHADGHGIIKDGDTLSAEGSYTIGYPLAVIAARRKDKQLAEIAFKQLILRRDLLWESGALFLRRQDDGTRTFRNWGRAYAWHLLGLIRSLEELRGKGLLTADQEQLIEEEFVHTLRQAYRFRDEHGLWSCFLDEPVTGVDTSASAGIAAAAAISSRIGIRPYSECGDATLSATSLLRYLTPDGLVTGTAQSNKNGEELQRSGYRVISQMTMGLLGQLLAAIGPQ
ncbi:glycoside hydrolase family 88 protein [Paenibacillus harenae]|uniref:glycoside hydrolase family 88 protein n=1 Tax=Paenibacillus harenae TaxID=306543 RepID=UPI00048D8A2D|nr:glycoside hydrolase family 88 protein [Paenibacillus harenae]